MIVVEIGPHSPFSSSLVQVGWTASFSLNKKAHLLQTIRYLPTFVMGFSSSEAAMMTRQI